MSLDSKMDIIIFLTGLSLFYLVSIYFYFSYRKKKRYKLKLEHDVIYAKRKELQETDVDEYLSFRDYSEKRMNEDFRDV